VGDNSNGDHDIEDQRCDTDGKDKPHEEIILATENPDPARWSESNKRQNWEESAPVQKE